MIPRYRYYRTQLQMLQWRYPEQRWALKSPWHLAYLDSLLDVFPDACVIQTHRDPIKVVPSICSLTAHCYGMGSDAVDPVRVGKAWLEEWADAWDKSIDVRDKAEPTRFCDVHYQDLVKDPVGAVRKIYGNFELEFTGEFKRAMKQWMAEDSKKKHHAGHSYSLEQFGLDKNMVNKRFAKYIDRYGIVGE